MKFEEICIVGLGLMGTSLAAGLKRKGFSGKIVGYARRQEACDYVLEKGYVDSASTDLAHCVENADLIILATNVLAMEPLVNKLLPHTLAGTVITDLGSTKEELVKSLSPLVHEAGCIFIGSHPLCGSEKQGPEACIEDLYEDRVVVVTPSDTTETDALDALGAFWSFLDTEVIVTSPREHDNLLARTSHLTHLMASILVGTVAREGTRGLVKDLSSTGFAKTTCLADGSPDMWHDIVKSNAIPVRQELTALKLEIEKLIADIDKNDFEAVRNYLEQTMLQRRELID